MFSPREEGDGAYWWRKELRRRAGILPVAAELLRGAFALETQRRAELNRRWIASGGWE